MLKKLIAHIKKLFAKEPKQKIVVTSNLQHYFVGQERLEEGDVVDPISETSNDDWDINHTECSEFS